MSHPALPTPPGDLAPAAAPAAAGTHEPLQLGSLPARAAEGAPLTAIRRRRTPPVVTATLAVLVVAALLWSIGTGGAVPLIDAGVRAGVPGLARWADIPTPGVGEAAAPLGVPAPLGATSSSYRLLPSGIAGQDVLAYDPCRPIHYVVSGTAPGSRGNLALQAAVARVSTATGLEFIDDGTTSEAPSERRALYQWSRYGDRWAPVLVAWATTAQDSELDGDVVGDAGSTAITRAGSPAVYVSGQVRLDAAQIAGVLAQPGGDAQVRAIIEHELGHLVGLGHVQDPTQLMNPTDTGRLTDYAAGDLTGLARLGRGACAPGI